MGNLRLGINIDHVATIRNARGGLHPDPVKAALIAAGAGADGITAHLREDRRHIKDNDIERLMKESGLPLNLEMAATDEMCSIALNARPHAVCLVPEKREEVTTEGGLDIIANKKYLKEYIKPLKDAGIRVSLFIDPAMSQIEAAVEVGTHVVELHTGRYCEEFARWRDGGNIKYEESLYDCVPSINDIRQAAGYVAKSGLECHAGHGLSFDSVSAIAAIPEIIELNIGHFIIGEAVFIGLGGCIRQMKEIMRVARQ